MLNRAPAVDFPEHRSEFSVGAVQPVAQRLHRANGEAGTAAEDNRPRAVAVGAGVAWTEFGRRRGEADMLDIEADQRGAAEAASSSRARSRRPARSRGQRTAMRISAAGCSGGGRRGVARRRAACRIAVTAGSAAGEARPVWRCLAAIAAARRPSAPAPRVSAPAVRNAATVAGSAGSVASARPRHQSSNAAQSAA